MKRSAYENRRQQAMPRVEFFDGTEMLALLNDLDGNPVGRNVNNMEQGNAGGNAGIINGGGNQRANDAGGNQQAPDVGGNQRDENLGGRNNTEGANDAGNLEDAGPSPNKRVRYSNSNSPTAAVATPSNGQSSGDRGQRQLQTCRKSTGGYYKSLIWSHICENVSGNITSFTCPLCSLQFRDGERCVNHMDNIHRDLTRYRAEDGDGYVCPFCSDPRPWFPTQWHFILHCAQTHMARTE